MDDLELFRLAGKVGALCAALPMLAVVLRRVPPGGTLLAQAMLVSLVVDAFAFPLRADGHTTLWLTYLYAPVQFALFLECVTDWRPRWIWSGLLAIAGAEWALLALPIETAIQVGAGLVVAVMAVRRRVWGLAVYAGACAPFLLAMAVLPISLTGPWADYYIGYQAMRVAGLVITTWALMQWPARRWEARHGRRVDPASIALRAAVSSDYSGNGGHPAHALRQATRRRF